MKALALFSGGLDSLLSVKIVRQQNIDVTALFFDTGFGGTNDKDKKEYLKRVIKQVDANIEIIDIKEQFIQDILFDPKYGYGKNFNPCIDCHANMVRIAIGLLEKFNAKFIISGEVLGQRPKSQIKTALEIVQDFGEAQGLLVRPLSAKLLPITIPEEKGWIDREQLLSISGRSREIQLKMVKEFGIEEYETPAGGCLLTEEHFSKRITDFLKFDKFELADIDILKAGRQLRLPNGAKLVIGKDKNDNEKIIEIQNDKFIKVYPPEGVMGPISLLSKENLTQEDKIISAQLILTYAKTDKDTEYCIKILDEDIIAKPLENKSMATKYFL